MPKIAFNKILLILLTFSLHSIFVGAMPAHPPNSCSHPQVIPGLPTTPIPVAGEINHLRTNFRSKISALADTQEDLQQNLDQEFEVQDAWFSGTEDTYFVLSRRWQNKFINIEKASTDQIAKNENYEYRLHLVYQSPGFTSIIDDIYMGTVHQIIKNQNGQSYLLISAKKNLY